MRYLRYSSSLLVLQSAGLDLDLPDLLDFALFEECLDLPPFEKPYRSRFKAQINCLFHGVTRAAQALAAQRGRGICCGSRLGATQHGHCGSRLYSCGSGSRPPRALFVQTRKNGSEGSAAIKARRKGNGHFQSFPHLEPEHNIFRVKIKLFRATYPE